MEKASENQNAIELLDGQWFTCELHGVPQVTEEFLNFMGGLRSKIGKKYVRDFCLNREFRIIIDNLSNDYLPRTKFILLLKEALTEVTTKDPNIQILVF